MASGKDIISDDGTASIMGASDEISEAHCGPCKATNKIDHYCEDCKVYLCDACKNAHKKSKTSKKHKILSGAKMPKPNQREKMKSSTYCRCNRNRKVMYYCPEHNDVLCFQCIMPEHGHCKMCSAVEKSEDYSTSKLDSLVKKLNTIRDKMETMQKKRIADGNKLVTITHECKNKMEQFRKDINSYLDGLEQLMLKDLARCEQKQRYDIDQHISSLSTRMQMVDVDKSQLDDAKEDGGKLAMFVSGITISKKLQEYETVLADVQKHAQRPVLQFEKNETLKDLHRHVTTLGSLKGNEALGYAFDEKLLLDLQIQFREEQKLMKEGQGDPWVGGCTFMPGGQLVLSCENSNKVQLFDSSFKELGELKVGTHAEPPFDTAAVDDKTIVVTLPRRKQVQVIQVLPEMKLGHVIQLDKACWGVDVFKNEIFTSCHIDNDYGEGEVRVLDMKGKLRNRIGLKQDGTFTFINPDYISVGKSGEKVFVSDRGLYAIFCVSLDGTVIYRYEDGVNLPRGIYADAGDNVCFCDRRDWLGEIKVLTKDGKHYGTLASYEGYMGNLHDNPRAIAMRESDYMLVVNFEEVPCMVMLKLMTL